MIKVLVTGSNGQLGKSIKYVKKKYSSLEFLLTTKKTIDISNYQSILNFVSNQKVDFIINCAAYTSVEKAENDLEKLKNVNVIGVKNLVEISKKYKIKLVHISSDYVFDGLVNHEKKEDCSTNPLNAYGRSKLLAEEIILKSSSESIILRTSWLFSPFGKNFVKTIIKMSKLKKEIPVINDQWGKPTYAIELADILIKLISSTMAFKNKIYHFSNNGNVSWFDFAKSIVKLNGSDCKIYPVSSKDYPSKVNRPKKIFLNTELIQNTLKIEIHDWRKLLLNCISLIK